MPTRISEAGFQSSPGFATGLLSSSRRTSKKKALVMEPSGSKSVTASVLPSTDEPMVSLVTRGQDFCSEELSYSVSENKYLTMAT